MSATSSSDPLEIIDYTDGAYDPARSNYVDLYIQIPPEGVNTSVSWTVDVDGAEIDSGTVNLTFSFGPSSYWLRRVYVYPTSKVLTWHFQGGTLGDQDFSIDLLIALIPIAYIRQAVGIPWRVVIPYVKDGGIWKKAQPMVHTADGWVDATS